MSERSSRSRIAALSAGLVSASLLLAAAAPALAQSPAASPMTSSIKNIAYISPEQAIDYGWNQQGYEGAVAAAALIGATLQKADGSGYPDPTAILHQLADDGAQLIIAQAGGYSTPASAFAAETNIPVLIYDRPELLKAGLVGDIETDSQQGSYLAGVMAATMSKTGTLGVVTSFADDTNWLKQSGGFIKGALDTNKDIKFSIASIPSGDYSDAAGGKTVTQTVIASGADIIIGMGDGSSFGMLDAVETATPPSGADKVWFIDVIGDKTDPKVDTNGALLSSVLWNFAPAFEDGIAQIDAGTFGTTSYTLDLANGGISLLQTPSITADAWAAVQTAQAGILDGSIVVPVAHSQAEITAMLPK